MSFIIGSLRQVTYCWGNKINKYKMGGECNTNEKDEIFIHDFSWTA